MSIDGIERQADRQLDSLDEALASGELSLAEYNAAVKELERDARDAFEEEREAAHDAVDAEFRY